MITKIKKSILDGILFSKSVYLRTTLLLLCVLVAFFATKLARADEDDEKLRVTIERHRLQSMQIEGLTFSSDVEVDSESFRLPRAKIRGTLRRLDAKHFKFIYQGNRLQLGERGTFQIEVTLTSTRNQLNFTCIDPFGVESKETVEAYAHNWSTLVSRQNAKRKGLLFSAGVGPTLVGYSQGSLGDLSEAVMTAKAAVEYRFRDSDWILGGSVFYTAFVLSSNMPGIELRFLGVNLRAGVGTELLPAPWRFAIMGGAYFSTTMATPNRFGYENVMGPQLYPSLSYRLDGGGVVNSYLKYSPIMDGFSFLLLSSAEFSGGVNYGFSGDYWGVGADFSVLQLVRSSGGISKTVTAGVNVTYRF